MRENSIRDYSDLEETLNCSKFNSTPTKNVDLLIRNRISAQLSRDRRKIYLSNLENQYDLLMHENINILNELRLLKESHKNISTEKEELQKQCQSKFPNCSCSLLDPQPSNNYQKMCENNSILKTDKSFGTLKNDASSGYSIILLIIFMFVWFLQDSNRDTKNGNIFDILF